MVIFFNIFKLMLVINKFFPRVYQSTKILFYLNDYTMYKH